MPPEELLPEIQARVTFLKQVPLFQGVGDDLLVKIADRLDEIGLIADEVLFNQDDEGDNFYIIHSGSVRITHGANQDEKENELARFEACDSFGEEALLFDKPRSATVTANEETYLYFLDRENFDWMLETIPQIKPFLTIFAQSHQIARRYNFDWLGEGEVIQFVRRRHPIRIVMELGVIILVFLIAITVFGFISYFLSDIFDFLLIVAWIIGILGGLVSIGIGVWTYLEWRNDYFIVTNYRVVWRERVLLRGSSQQEAPLRTIQSLNTQTQNFFERLINVGDVIVRTFNSELRMNEVHEPERMKSIVEAFILRSRQRSRKLELETIRHTIRTRLGYVPPDAKAPEEIELPQVEGGDRVRLNPFATRIIEGDVITYRKHWSVFLKSAWLPSLLLLVVFILSIATLFFLTDLTPAMLRLALLVLILLWLAVGVWWGYEYVDWRNDLYQLTKDLVIDREKRPLGKESSRSAPIKNIQSLGHEIPSFIGMILNVGSVQINVGDSTLDFKGVYDPAVVHQDISRRMEELFAKQESERVAQEHARMATWLEIYHQETGQQHDPQNPSALN